jgi:hypothetical protein
MKTTAENALGIPLLPAIPTLDTDGLLSRWLLDGNANDSIGGRNGTWSGTTRYCYESLFGRQVGYFNGASCITFNASGLPSGASAGTISCWVKVPIAYTSGHQGIFGMSGLQNSTARGLFADMSSFAFIMSGWGSAYDVGTGVYAPSHGWAHLASVYNGSTVLAYVDGVIQASLTATLATSTAYGSIGIMTGGTAYLQGGMISDCRTYNVAKTAAQILAMAQLKS